MQPQTLVEYGDIKIHVVEANGVMGMRRAVLAYHGVEANKAEPNADPALQIWRASHYPNLVSAVASAEGKLVVYDEKGDELEVDLSNWPPSLEQCMLMPDRLIAGWETAVFEMNPHWALREPTAAVQKKR